MQITILGTSCMVPTKERNVSGTFIKFKEEGILLDCGEGTQRQMNITGIKRTDVTKILITHWHGDHVSGMIGLIQTISDKEHPPKIDIYGPRETKERMHHLMETAIFDRRGIHITVHELDPKGVETFFETEDYMLQCAPLDHATPCVGYSFTEKERRNIHVAYLEKHKIPDGPHLKKLKEGHSITYKDTHIDVEEATYQVNSKKIVYALDTQPCDGLLQLAMDADILITEASYLDESRDKARAHKHLTAKEAALIANNACVKKLILTHFSQRYKTLLPLQEEAQTYFDNVVSAEDFMKIKP